MIIQIGWASKYKQIFKRKWGAMIGPAERKGVRREGDFDRLEWEWIRDYLAGCLGGSDEANRKKE
jgi:hypothetical protein